MRQVPENSPSSKFPPQKYSTSGPCYRSWQLPNSRESIGAKCIFTSRRPFFPHSDSPLTLQFVELRQMPPKSCSLPVSRLRRAENARRGLRMLYFRSYFSSADFRLVMAMVERVHEKESTAGKQHSIFSAKFAVKVVRTHAAVQPGPRLGILTIFSSLSWVNNRYQYWFAPFSVCTDRCF